MRFSFGDKGLGLSLSPVSVVPALFCIIGGDILLFLLSFLLVSLTFNLLTVRW